MDEGYYSLDLYKQKVALKAAETNLRKFDDGLNIQFSYWGNSKDVQVFYISDIHLEHHIKFYNPDFVFGDVLDEKAMAKTARCIARQLKDSLPTRSYFNYINPLTSRVILFGGDICCSIYWSKYFYEYFLRLFVYDSYLVNKERLVNIRDLQDKQENYIPKCLDEIASLKKQIRQAGLDYDRLVVKSLVGDNTWKVRELLNSKSYKRRKVSAAVTELFEQCAKLLDDVYRIENRIKDTLEEFHVGNLSEIDLRSFTYYPMYGYNDISMFLVLGNHEMAEFDSVDNCVAVYKAALSNTCIHVLHNETFSFDKFLIYGGTGFGQYNNDGHKGYEMVTCRDMIGNQKYMVREGMRFETGYQCAYGMANEQHKPLLCAIHFSVEDCLKQYDRDVIYFTGHTHRNRFIKDETRVLYADNQVGYKKHSNIGFKSAFTGCVPNPYIDLEDGMHLTSVEDYEQFGLFSVMFNGEAKLLRNYSVNGKMYVIKSNGYYGFFILDDKGILFVNGKRFSRLTNSTNLEWIKDNFDIILNKYLSVMSPLRAVQEKLSNELKAVGCEGIIHGLIVDIDCQNHIMVNPFENRLIFYNSPWFGVVRTFDDVFSWLDGLIDIAKEYRSEWRLFYALSLRERVQNLVSKSKQGLMLVTNSTLNMSVSSVSNGFVSVGTTDGAYGMSRKIAPLQKLFTANTLQAFDLTLVEVENEQPVVRKVSYFGRIFTRWNDDSLEYECYIVLEDNCGEFIEIGSLDNGSVSKMSILPFKRLFNGGRKRGSKATWFTKSFEETMNPDLNEFDMRPKIEEYFPSILTDGKYVSDVKLLEGNIVECE